MLVLALAWGGVPAIRADEPIAEEPAAGASEESVGGRITGKIRWARGIDGDPVEGARVLAFHVGEQKMYASEPVRRNGNFVLRGLPRGFYDVAVEIGSDVYVASEVSHLPPGTNLRIDFDLAPFPGGVAPADRETFLGTGTAGAGLANTNRKLRGREFWFSPKGLVIMSGVAGAALLGIALTSGDDEVPASPSIP